MEAVDGCFRVCSQSRCTLLFLLSKQVYIALLHHAQFKSCNFSGHPGVIDFTCNTSEFTYNTSDFKRTYVFSLWQYFMPISRTAPCMLFHLWLIGPVSCKHVFMVPYATVVYTGIYKTLETIYRDPCTTCAGLHSK